MTDFTNQVAVVTGASSGIGRAIASGLAAKGATLCLIGRSIEELKNFSASLKIGSTRIQLCRVDLGLDDDIEELKKNIEENLGRVDILVHSAGALSLGPIESVPISDFDWHYRINVRAPSLLTQALLPMLKMQKGQIVFMNSKVGLNSKANYSQYAATKHALRAFADSLREEVNEMGIRVLSVFSGSTATPMQEKIFNWEGKDYAPNRLMKPQDVAEIVIHTLSLPRTAEVTDIIIRPMAKF
jgi:short-subunit dehydrogenase